MINYVFKKCGINKIIKDNKIKLNKNSNVYSPSKKQILRIKHIYSRDFEIYESVDSNCKQ